MSADSDVSKRTASTRSLEGAIGAQAAITNAVAISSMAGLVVIVVASYFLNALRGHEERALDAWAIIAVAVAAVTAIAYVTRGFVRYVRELCDLQALENDGER